MRVKASYDQKTSKSQDDEVNPFIGTHEYLVVPGEGNNLDLMLMERYASQGNKQLSKMLKQPKMIMRKAPSLNKPYDDMMTGLNHTKEYKLPEINKTIEIAPDKNGTYKYREKGSDEWIDREFLKAKGGKIPPLTKENLLKVIDNLEYK